MYSTWRQHIQPCTFTTSELCSREHLLLHLVCTSAHPGLLTLPSPLINSDYCVCTYVYTLQSFADTSLLPSASCIRCVWLVKHACSRLSRLSLQASPFSMCKSLCVILGASPFPRSQRGQLSHFALSRIFPSAWPADVLCP
jgi:hypothetical protein